jgi:hypothetical protein
MSREKIYSLAEHYPLRRPAGFNGNTFNSDNQVEVRELVDMIIDTAKREMRDDLAKHGIPVSFR